jgi:NADH:ubiquinone oxidoreductase subunit D
MRESVKILQQALKDITGGEIFAGRKGWQVKIQKGEAYGRVENPKGATGFYVVSDGGTNPYRYHVHTPSFINIGVLNLMSRGGKVADAVINLGSIDINLGELDR